MPANETIDGSGGIVPGSGEPSPSGAGSTGSKGDRMAPSRATWRRRLVTLLAILTCIGTLTSVVAVWSHRLLLNTNAWVETVGPLASDPAVTDAVATALTNEVFQLINPEQLAKDALPDRADFLAAPMTNALHGFVDEQTKKLLETEQFQQFWVEANRIVHENAVKLLRGETVAGFTAQDGVVTLNILPLLSKTLQWLLDKAPGVLGERITVPTITQSTPPDQARAELSAVFHVTLPDTFGVYTVLRSDSLASAQTAVRLFDRLVYLIVIVTLGLLAATLALSLNRRRTLILLGVGITLAMVLADAVTRAIEKLVLELIAGPQAREAAESTITTLIGDLHTLTNGLLIVGIALVVIAFLAGEGRIATGLRQGVARLANRGEVDPTDDGHASALPFLTHYASMFKVAGAVVAVIALVAIDVTITSLVLILVLLALYELVITGLTMDRSASAPLAAAGVGPAGTRPDPDDGGPTTPRSRTPS